MNTINCPSCGKPCNPTNINVGIGCYEYHGSFGIDVTIITVSDCCDAQLDQDELERFWLNDCYNERDH